MVTGTPDAVCKFDHAFLLQIGKANVAFIRSCCSTLASCYRNDCARHSRCRLLSQPMPVLMLALTGKTFWQEEGYDHLVRHMREFDKIRNYIEENPVRAGFVRGASEYRWSSAGSATDSCGDAQIRFTDR